MNVEIRRFRSTGEFNQADWDRFHSGDFYFGYEFLKVVEASSVNNSRCYYLTFQHGGMPVGSAVISCFDLNLDLLSGNPPFIRFVKKITPASLKMKVVCCGLPVSFGQHHCSVLDLRFMNTIIDEVHNSMRAIAKDHGASLLAWKEFPTDFAGKEKLVELGYRSMNSIPDTVIHANVSSYPEYLARFKSAYRRKLKDVQAALEGNATKLNYSITIQPFTRAHVQSFYQGYLQVISRTPVKLEIYPVGFFENLCDAQEIQPLIMNISDHSGNEISALLVRDKALNFILISKNNERYQHNLYVELIRAIVCYGINSGFTKIKLGQTSYYSKLSTGASVQPLNIFLKSGNPVTRAILKYMGNILFPDTIIPQLAPFKQ